MELQEGNGDLGSTVGKAVETVQMAMVTAVAEIVKVTMAVVEAAKVKEEMEAAAMEEAAMAMVTEED